MGLERFGPKRLLLRLAALVPQATNLLEPSEEKWWVEVRESVGWAREVRGEYPTATVLTAGNSSTCMRWLG